MFRRSLKFIYSTYMEMVRALKGLHQPSPMLHYTSTLTGHLIGYAGSTAP